MASHHLTCLRWVLFLGEPGNTQGVMAHKAPAWRAHTHGHGAWVLGRRGRQGVCWKCCWTELETFLFTARIAVRGLPAALQLSGQSLVSITGNKWETEAKFNFSRCLSEMLVIGFWTYFFYIKYKGYCWQWLVKSLRNKREFQLKGLFVRATILMNCCEGFLLL